MKRVNIFLLLILAAAMVLFSGYLLWIHGNLDTIGPVFSVEEGILEISVKDPAEALLQGITAVDERDGDVTEGILVESVYGISDENLTTVTYAAFDSAGNVSKFQRQVRYSDYREPRFELYASPTFAYGSGFDLLEQEAYRTAADRCLSKLLKKTRITGAIDECQGDTKGIGIFAQTYDVMPFAQGMALRAINIRKSKDKSI